MTLSHPIAEHTAISILYLQLDLSPAYMSLLLDVQELSQTYQVQNRTLEFTNLKPDSKFIVPSHPQSNPST